jgi:hypothetical protein
MTNDEAKTTTFANITVSTTTDKLISKYLFTVIHL